MRVYNEFVEERLKPNSTKYINDPLKKVMLKTCKSAIKPRKIKVNDKTKELRGNCNLFARCALIQGKRNIDMKVIVGDYELTVFPKSLFTSDGSLLDGSKSKSDAVTEVMKAAEVEPNEQLPLNPDCVVFDAMRLLNEMNTKKFKTGNDLLNEFLRRIDVISSNAQIRIVSFDTYRESSSLKDSIRITHKKPSIPPRYFNICLETDIERVSMPELLASNTTKKSLTELLMPQVIKHMKEQNADYVVAGNCKTYWSLNGQIDEAENDHERQKVLFYDN